MRRPRKGTVFRVPTTAESAATADAVDAHRRRPPRPQDKPPTGQDILVKTPAAGIPARCGTTVYSATCTRCILTGPIDEKTIEETDEELEVSNIYNDAVTGSIYVVTSLLEDGTRYVSGEPC